MFNGLFFTFWILSGHSCVYQIHPPFFRFTFIHILSEILHNNVQFPRGTSINYCFIKESEESFQQNRLFYNFGFIINFFFTEKYFDMNKKSCKEALDIYKKFITRMDRVSEFLKVAEDVGFDKDDIPDLSKVVYQKSSKLSFLGSHCGCLFAERDEVVLNLL